MKPPKDINYVLFECNYSLKSPRQMKFFLIMVYIKEYHSDSKYIIRDSNFQWRLFVIQKLTRTWMIRFYVYKSLSLYNVCIETPHTNNQTIIYSSIYGQNKLLKISVIQELSIKFVDIWMQWLFLHQ